MKYFTFFVLFLCWNGVFADFGFDYFYMEGRVFGVDEQPLRNEVIYFRDAAGEISRVKTDNHGVYRVKSNYILPCLSGANGNKRKERKLAFAYNFPTVSVYHKSYCAELPQQWSQFYFDSEKRRDKKQKALQNIRFTDDCELIQDRIEGYEELHSQNRQKMIQDCQYSENSKTGLNLYYRMRTFLEPLGLNDEEFLQGFGFSNQCDVVDSISEDKIEISFLTDWYGSRFKKTTYIYLKRNGIIVEENIKHEYPSSE